MDDLDGPVRRALHDARLDLSLEFRRGPDGTKRGTLLIADASGETVARVPLESPEAMNVALARLVQLGFARRAVTAAAPAHRDERARRRRRRLPQGLGGGCARPERRRPGLDARELLGGALLAGPRDRRRHPDRPARPRRPPGRRRRPRLRRRQPREQRLPDAAARGARGADLRRGERDRAHDHGQGDLAAGVRARAEDPRGARARRGRRARDRDAPGGLVPRARRRARARVEAHGRRARAPA